MVVAAGSLGVVILDDAVGECSALPGSVVCVLVPRTLAIPELIQFRSTLNQADLDRLLDGNCPWHKDTNHTARECRALSNGVFKDDDYKRPRRDRPSGSRTTRARPRRRNSPRRDNDEQREDFIGNFQEEDMAVNFIFGGPSKPSC